MAKALLQSAGPEQSPLFQVVRRRRTECFLQLPGSPPQQPAEQDCDHFRGGRRHGQQNHLQAALPPRLPVCQRAEVHRRQDRRPRHHLHADVDRSRHCHAGLRAHRRDALGRVRRLLGQEPSGTHHRCRRDRGHHRGRTDARWQGDRAQTGDRRSPGDGRMRSHQECRGLQAHRQPNQDGYAAR